MCGIFGIIYRSRDHLVDDDLMIAATNEMSHRGPDDWGTYIDGHVGLGHRRLSIIDLASGHQPMHNEDGRITIVYNGEIYNHTETRELLVTKGHRFHTHSDTEVIIHAYEEWGTQAVTRFNGMFAFLLWDSTHQTMWIVRDRLGIKPLYYVETDKAVIFASEIKALLKTGLVKAVINERVLDAFFTLGYVPGPETMFKNIYKVLPGHYHVMKDGGQSIYSYWDFNTIEPLDVPFGKALQEAGDLLMDSVKIRMMSDVPLGVFLSGGLDSSAIAAFMGQVTPDPIKTFTVGYSACPSVSEEDYARIVADKLKTDHQVFHLEAENFFSSLHTLLHYSEEPLVEPAAIALYHLARLAKEKATVMLSGEGSDEVFGGYHIYSHMLFIEKWQRRIPSIFQQFCRIVSQALGRVKYSKAVDWFGAPLEQRFQGTSAQLTPTIKKRFYTQDFFDRRGAYLDDCFAHHFQKVQHRDDCLGKILYVDTKTWLVDNLLLKADKMTMAAGVELRVPFLDYRLVEFLWSLPEHFKITGNKGKVLLKQVINGYLPEEIIHRTKMGFPVPTSDWFRHDATGRIANLLDEFSERGWFNQNTIKLLFDQHKGGNEDHSRLLMTFIVLEEWIKQYV
ncbi:MAG: asparagine synthase (glutamine-hydrolyzing) [Smithellaceae bacterium]